MERGKLIYLNGVTSTGKSTVAHLMRRMSHTIFYTSSNDIFHGMTDFDHFDDFYTLVAHSVTAQYYAVRGLLDGGFSVILDGMFLDLPAYRSLFGQSNVALFRSIFSGCDVTTVELYCDPIELRRRNRVRGNRGEGQSDEQLSHMTASLTHDLSLDAMTMMPDECAEAILSHCGLSYDRLPTEIRTRHRVRLLSDLLHDNNVRIESADTDDGLVRTTVSLRDTAQAKTVRGDLLRRGYYAGEDAATLIRIWQKKTSEICRIRAKP